MLKNMTLWSLLIVVLGGLGLMFWLMSKTPSPPQLMNTPQPNVVTPDNLLALMFSNIGRWFAQLFDTLNPFKIRF